MSTESLKPDPEAGGEEETGPSTNSRVLGAFAYVPLLCFLPYFVAPEDDFARHHGRFGFLFLCLIIVLGVALRVLEWAMAPIPYLGALAIAVARLGFGFVILGLAVAGAVKGLLGDRWSLPNLNRLADRVPL